MGLAFTKRGVEFKGVDDLKKWRLQDVRRAFGRWEDSRVPLERSPDKGDGKDAEEDAEDANLMTARLHFEYRLPRRRFFEVFNCMQSDERYLSLLHHFGRFDIANTGRANVYEAFTALILLCNSPLPSKVDLFFHVFGSEDRNHASITNEGKVLTPHDMKFLLNTMAVTVWKLRGAVQADYVPKAKIDALAVEMFYLADSDMNGGVEWDEFEVWGAAQVKSKALINRITPLDPAIIEASNAHNMPLHQQLSLRRLLSKQNSTTSLRSRSMRSLGSDNSNKRGRRRRASTGTKHGGGGGSDGSLSSISEEDSGSDTSEALRVALTEMNEQQLREALQVEEEHMAAKRRKRAQQLVSGVALSSSSSDTDYIEEEVHEHALGSSDSSDGSDGDYGRRGELPAGTKRMRDPLLRSRNRRARERAQRNVGGKRRKSSTIASPVLAHQMLANLPDISSSDDDNASDDEEGADSFAMPPVASTLASMRTGPHTMRSTMNRSFLARGGDLHTSVGDTEAVASAQSKRARRASMLAGARRRRSTVLLHMTNETKSPVMSFTSARRASIRSDRSGRSAASKRRADVSPALAASSGAPPRSRRRSSVDPGIGSMPVLPPELPGTMPLPTPGASAATSRRPSYMAPKKIDRRRRSVMHGKAVVELSKKALEKYAGAEAEAVRATQAIDQAKQPKHPPHPAKLRRRHRQSHSHNRKASTTGRDARQASARKDKESNPALKGSTKSQKPKGGIKFPTGPQDPKTGFMTAKLLKMRRHTSFMKLKSMTSKRYVASTSKQTSFTKNEIRKMAPHFAKLSEVTGEMSYESFVAIIRTHMPAFADWEPRLKWFFTTLDADGNGSVSFREFCVGLSIILRGDMDSRLRLLFKIHDVNKNGKISVRELIHLVTTGNMELEDLLHRADKIVSSLDCDDDNEITSDEFIASLHQHPELMDNFSQSTTVSVEMAAAIRELHHMQPEFSAQRLRHVPDKFAGHMHLLTQKVNKQGFHEFMAKCFDCTSAMHGQLDKMFDSMDQRKVGYLTLRVLLNNFAQMLCRTVQEQTEFYFALYDIDGSGTLDSNEIVFMLLSTQMSANPAAAAVLDMIHYMDQSCSGYVSMADFVARAVRSQLVMDTMHRLFAVQLATQLNPEHMFAPPPKLTEKTRSWKKALAYVATPRIVALYEGGKTTPRRTPDGSGHSVSAASLSPHGSPGPKRKVPSKRHLRAAGHAVGVAKSLHGKAKSTAKSTKMVSSASARSLARRAVGKANGGTLTESASVPAMKTMADLPTYTPRGSRFQRRAKGDDNQRQALLHLGTPAVRHGNGGSDGDGEGDGDMLGGPETVSGAEQAPLSSSAAAAGVAAAQRTAQRRKERRQRTLKRRTEAHRRRKEAARASEEKRRLARRKSSRAAKRASRAADEEQRAAAHSADGGSSVVEQIAGMVAAQEQDVGSDSGARSVATVLTAGASGAYSDSSQRQGSGGGGSSSGVANKFGFGMPTGAQVRAQARAAVASKFHHERDAATEAMMLAAKQPDARAVVLMPRTSKAVAAVLDVTQRAAGSVVAAKAPSPAHNPRLMPSYSLRDLGGILKASEDHLRSIGLQARQQLVRGGNKYKPAALTSGRPDRSSPAAVATSPATSPTTDVPALWKKYGLTDKRPEQSGRGPRLGSTQSGFVIMPTVPDATQAAPAPAAAAASRRNAALASLGGKWRPEKRSPVKRVAPGGHGFQLPKPSRFQGVHAAGGHSHRAQGAMRARGVASSVRRSARRRVNAPVSYNRMPSRRR